MEIQGIQDSFSAGKWSAWLREFNIGDVQLKDLPRDTIGRIRTCASALKKQGLFFSITTQKGRMRVQRVTEQDWYRGTEKNADFQQDPFEVGAWFDWLRTFGVGDYKMVEVTPKQRASIRVSATKLRKEGYYFATAMAKTEEGPEKFVVVRLEKERWERSPRRQTTPG